MSIFFSSHNSVWILIEWGAINFSIANIFIEEITSFYDYVFNLILFISTRVLIILYLILLKKKLTFTLKLKLRIMENFILILKI